MWVAERERDPIKGDLVPFILILIWQSRCRVRTFTMLVLVLRTDANLWAVPKTNPWKFMKNKTKTTTAVCYCPFGELLFEKSLSVPKMTQVSLFFPADKRLTVRAFFPGLFSPCHVCLKKVSFKNDAAAAAQRPAIFACIGKYRRIQSKPITCSLQ